MSVDLSGFDAETTEDAGGNFDPIPVGEYEAVISGSEEKPTKAGTGSMMKMEFTIVSGPFANRKLWTNLNLNNPSEAAVKIARGELKQICYAVGVLKPTSSADLHDIPLLIKVGMEKRKDTGELQNRIKGYKSKNAALAPAPQQQQPPKQSPAPVGVGTGTPPWKR